ncbi:hypothetical protein FB45DRAFT_1060694 [Roridomyces roridus]|uniref:Uncharacterized protein n=1 Tax=Roridomyces roridus TaxID=1738132 RepID=A0AAD7BKW5_9AGAR|nr:hypothetical protein FB45DRAFT_1060694 [Roridomyces roridus]
MASDDELTHEGDSGECDNRTVPISRTLGLSGGPYRYQRGEALIREGRAICPIMSAHGWEPALINKIFGEGTVYASDLQGREVTADDVRDDYDHVGEHFKPGYPLLTELGRSISGSHDPEKSVLPSLTILRIQTRTWIAFHPLDLSLLNLAGINNDVLVLHRSESYPEKGLRGPAAKKRPLPEDERCPNEHDG